MSKIKELLKNEDSILVFDVDGVLATMEWGTYNHFALKDDDWTKACEDGINNYTEDKVSKKMQMFLNARDKSKVYVITTAGGKNEDGFKREFVNKYYGIYKENVYCVREDSQKLCKLECIKEKYKEIEDYKIVMTEDSVKILNDIMDKSNFSTVHISSFLDI